MSDKKILWFDTETTGLDSKKNDIIQIAGIVEINDLWVEEFEFKCAPWDKNNIEQEALDVYGFTKDEICSWRDPFNVYSELKQIFSKYIDPYNREDKFIPAGHNVGFDVSFLKSFFEKSGDRFFGSFFNYHTLDTLPLFITLDHLNIVDKPLNYKLKTMAELFDIEIKAHDALSDIKATRSSFLKMASLIVSKK